MHPYIEGTWRHEIESVMTPKLKSQIPMIRKSAVNLFALCEEPAFNHRENPIL